MTRAALAIAILGCASLAGCQGAVADAPLRPVSHLDLPRYMGSWYVIASIPTRFGRDARDYTWLMARTPHITSAQYRDVLRRLRAMGYDLSKLRVSPQRWPEAGSQPAKFGESCR